MSGSAGSATSGRRGGTQRPSTPHGAERMTPASRRPALRVTGRDLDDDDRESVGVAGHHLDQTPGLALRLLLDHDTRGGEPAPRLLHVTDLKQQPDGTGWRLARGSRDLEESSAEEEHHAAVGSAAPLAKDGEAERLAVEAQRALEVAGVEQNSAGEDVHAGRGSRRPRSYVRELGASPARARVRAVRLLKSWRRSPARSGFLRRHYRCRSDAGTDRVPADARSSRATEQSAASATDLLPCMGCSTSDLGTEKYPKS